MASALQSDWAANDPTGLQYICNRPPITYVSQLEKTIVSGNLSVSGNIIGDIDYAQITNKPTYASVATTGSYSELIGKPTLFSGAYTDLSGKPTLFSGSYTDLTSKPTLFSGVYADLTSKPSLFSGAYSDLTGKPTSMTLTDIQSGSTQSINILNAAGVLTSQFASDGSFRNYNNYIGAPYFSSSGGSTIAGSATTNTYTTYFQYNSGTLMPHATGWTVGYSFYGANNFVCAGAAFIAYSDERIKTPFQGAWDDLETINRLTVRRYTYRDPVRYCDERATAESGNLEARVKIGFFAHEVRDVLPEAITYYSEAVPDIQEVCSFSGSKIGWSGSNISVGDTINLVNDDGSNGGAWGYDVKVVDITSSNITIDNAEKMTGSNVFVYGHKVDDFLGLNQDCISAVTVGAVQRLSQKVDEQKIIINSLIERIIALEG